MKECDESPCDATFEESVDLVTETTENNNNSIISTEVSDTSTLTTVAEKADNSNSTSDEATEQESIELETTIITTTSPDSKVKNLKQSDQEPTQSQSLEETSVDDDKDCSESPSKKGASKRKIRPPRQSVHSSPVKRTTRQRKTRGLFFILYFI